MRRWPRLGFLSSLRLGRSRAARVAVAIVTMLTIAGAGEARNGTDPTGQSIRTGLAAYREGRFEEARAAFEAAVLREPSLAVPRYNAAAACYRLGRYTEAHAGYLQARDRAGPALRTKIDFALGNSALASGDIAAAIGHYDDCLGSGVPGTDLDAVRRDAAINREFAVEQAKSLGADQAPQPSPESQGGRERGRRNPDGSEQDPSAGDEEPENDPNEANSEDGPNGSAGRRRRSGGAGGEGDRAKGSRDNPDSPDRRLDAAIDQIRDARRRRLPDDDSTPDSGTQDDRRDW